MLYKTTYNEQKVKLRLRKIHCMCVWGGGNVLFRKINTCTRIKRNFLMVNFTYAERSNDHAF